MTLWAPSAPSATRPPATASVSRGPRVASVHTACRVSGASLNAGRASAMATVSTATLRLESVRAAETSPPDITARGEDVNLDAVQANWCWFLSANTREVDTVYI